MIEGITSQDKCYILQTGNGKEKCNLQKNSVFILAVIAVVIGVFVAGLWFFIGSFFLFGFIAGIMEGASGEEIPLTFGNLAPGLTIVLIQSIVTVVAFIIALVKAVPAHLNSNLSKNGIWILVLGFIIFIVNPLQIVPGVLLIIGGVIAIKESSSDIEKDLIDN